MTATGVEVVQIRFLTADLEEVVTSLDRADPSEIVRGYPIRQIRSYARQKHYPGWFWSATTGDHIRYESRLELRRLWLADFDPSVTFIAAQPMHLSGQAGDRYFSHTPDFLFEHPGREYTLVDVKPAEFAARAEVAEVFDWTRRLCASRGWDYEVWSGADHVLLSNLQFLSGFRRDWLFPPHLLEAVDAAFRPGCTIGELAAEIDPGQAGRAAVLNSIWHGRLATDLTLPLSSGSVLYLPDDRR